MSENYSGIKKLTATVALFSVTLTGCSESKPTPAPKGEYISSCIPLSVKLSKTTQDSIISTSQWPASLNSLHHQGNILGVRVVSGDPVNPNLDHSNVVRIQKVVDVFLRNFNPLNQHTEVQVQFDSKLTDHRLQISEYDENCAGIIYGTQPIPTRITHAA